MSAGFASGVDMSKDAKQHVAGVATTGVANTGADAGGSDGRFRRTVACAELTIRTAAAPVACDVLTIRATAARGRDLHLYRLVLGFISAHSGAWGGGRWVYHRCAGWGGGSERDSLCCCAHTHMRHSRIHTLDSITYARRDIVAAETHVHTETNGRSGPSTRICIYIDTCTHAHGHIDIVTHGHIPDEAELRLRHHGALLHHWRSRWHYHLLHMYRCGGECNKCLCVFVCVRRRL